MSTAPNDQAETVGNSSPARIFISYKRSMPVDEKLAHAIRDGFAKLGHHVFIDVGMKVGTDWVSEITRRIDWCDFLVVLLSEEAVASEMVQAEVRRAYRRRRRDGRPAILPVRVNYRGALGYELEAFLGRIRSIIWTSDRDTAQVIAGLEASITEGTQASVQSSPSLDQLDVSAPSQLLGDRRRPYASEDPRVLLAPGGAVKLDDLFYVRTDSDSRVDKIAESSGQTVVIQAPRQMGKSSLLIRYLAACKAQGKQFAFIDFHSFSEADLSGTAALSRRIAHILLRAFKLKSDTDFVFANLLDFKYFVEDAILKTAEAPITIAMDDVDLILGRPYQSEFFSMLRSWHNGRAQPSSPWESVDLAMTIATEMYLLITAPDRSPFNVTSPIEVEPFQRMHLHQINAAYGNPLIDVELDQLYDLLSGHPYLTRLAFYQLVSSQGLNFETLMTTSADNDGPFGEHLRSTLFIPQQQRELLTAMKSVAKKSTVLDRDVSYRLRALGLVKRREKDVVPANLLYARFFSRLL